jgi:hypothetical protein
VGRCLASRRGAVVAAETGAQHVGVIDPQHRAPAGRLQLVVLWQSSQTLVVWICVVDLPVAVVPL